MHIGGVRYEVRSFELTTQGDAHTVAIELAHGRETSALVVRDDAPWMWQLRRWSARRRATAQATPVAFESPPLVWVPSEQAILESPVFGAKSLVAARLTVPRVAPIDELRYRLELELEGITLTLTERGGFDGSATSGEPSGARIPFRATLHAVPRKSGAPFREMSAVEASAVGASFLERLDREPGDLDTRLVYADWLEDHDRLDLATIERRRVDVASHAPGEHVALLTAIDHAILGVMPSQLHALRPGASPERLAALAAEMGTLPVELEAWFRWHDGAPRAGAMPGTDLRFLSTSEAIAVVGPRRAAIASAIGEGDAPPPMCALVANDRALFVYVAREAAGGGPFVFGYAEDASLEVEPRPMSAWLARLRDAWIAEKSLVHTSRVQVNRSPMGWHELVVQRRAKDSFAAAVMRVADGESFAIGGDHVVFAAGDETRIHVGRLGDLRVTLRRSDARAVSVAIGEAAEDTTLHLPELGELRLTFSRWLR
jgi:uncharacterized protein (TIGR02996 family)